MKSASSEHQAPAITKQQTIWIDTASCLLIIVCTAMMLAAQQRLHELRSIKNISLNIINLWIYRFIIISLGIQILLNLYLVVVQFNSFVDQDEVWLHEHLWFSFLVCSLIKLEIIIFSNLVFYFQICEWFSILYVIRTERKSNLKSLARKSEESASVVTNFTLNEIKIKKCLLVAAIAFSCVYVGQYGYWVRENL